MVTLLGIAATGHRESPAAFESRGAMMGNVVQEDSSGAGDWERSGGEWGVGMQERSPPSNVKLQRRGCEARVC